MPIAKYKLGSPEFVEALKEALGRMVSQPKEVRPFVIVEDTILKRFVQFAGSFSEPLIMVDCPLRLHMEPKNRNVQNVMMAALLLDEPKPPNEFGVCIFQKRFSTMTEAICVAQNILRDVLELPEGVADLTIIEDRSDKEKAN